ncbi:hypothetical protein B0H21DRAFT_819620 [Amylocystis lapponica]|nr:hypothetical protein B0H21DRAFT_819620 [Amylocystis lapponica]
MYSNESTPPPFSSTASSSCVEHADAHMSSLEQDFCSNFSCCGLALADLHELVDHFEEYHVVVLGRDGRPTYPPPVADPESDATSLDAATSVVLSYPQTDPPEPLSSLESLLDPDFPLTQAARTYRDITDADAGLDAVSYSSGSTLPSPARESMCLPPSLLSVSPMIQSEPRSISTSKTKHKSDSSSRAKPWKGSTAPRVERRTDARHVHTKKREREKAFKCPHPGCMKSYLNPNGLKYHLEKGTCTTADA